MKHRWGTHTTEVREHLDRTAITVKRSNGNRQRYVHNFSQIGRKYGVTRELVRQIAEDLGIRSFHRAPHGVKRVLLRQAKNVKSQSI